MGWGAMWRGGMGRCVAWWDGVSLWWGLHVRCRVWNGCGMDEVRGIDVAPGPGWGQGTGLNGLQLVLRQRHQWPVSGFVVNSHPRC